MHKSLYALLMRKKFCRCVWCGRKLDQTEVKYYGDSCSKCQEKIAKEFSKKNKRNT